MKRMSVRRPRSGRSGRRRGAQKAGAAGAAGAARGGRAGAGAGAASVAVRASAAANAAHRPPRGSASLTIDGHAFFGRIRYLGNLTWPGYSPNNQANQGSTATKTRSDFSHSVRSPEVLWTIGFSQPKIGNRA